MKFNYQVKSELPQHGMSPNMRKQKRKTNQKNQTLCYCKSKLCYFQLHKINEEAHCVAARKCQCSQLKDV